MAVAAPTIDYRGTYDWVIEGDTLLNFKTADPSQPFKSPEFEIGSKIKWQLEGYPNGKIPADEHNCQMYLVSASFPDHITKIIIYYELHCPQTISNFVGIKTFTEPNDSTVWFRGVLPTEELTNLPDTTKSLHFQCTINVLHIESKDSVLFEYPLSIDFHKQSQFVLDWKLKGDTLQQFLAVPHGKFISSNKIHAGLFSLQCAPDGYRTKDHGSVRLFMQLCALPAGIRSITLTRKLECMERHIEKESAKQVPWGYVNSKNDDAPKMRQNSGWGGTALKREDVSHLDEINFRATVNILRYTTSDGKTIEIIPPEDASPKKRKRSVSPAPPDDKKEDDAYDGDGEEEKKGDDTEEKKEEEVVKKPPKKKRKTAKKKTKDKEEATSDDEDVKEVKQIEINDEIGGSYEWTLSNDLLQQFKTAKYRTCWTSPEFIVHELKWVIEIFPAGHNKKDKDEKSAMIFLTMVTPLSDQIAKMMVCYTLYCKPSLCSYTTISAYTTASNSFGYCGGLLSQKELGELNNTFAHKVTIGAKLMILNTMDGEDVKKKIYKQIYPLQIKSNEDGISGEDSECFSRKCKFEWKVEKQEMIKFKKAYNGKYFESSTFNGNMWSLRCAPNGDQKEDEGKVNLWLQLNSLPKGIGKMKVVFELKCVETNKSAYLVHNYNVLKSVAGWDSDVLKLEDIQGLDSLTFTASIDIDFFYDTNSKRIKTL
eukprot:46993_1